jgi:hypothetical protein
MQVQKLIKNVAIAHSGLYTYARSEIPTLNLNLTDMPEAYAKYDRFNVYRSAPVMIKATPLFTRLPITVEHPNSPVTPRNSKDLANGLSGDTAVANYRNGEVYIDSTLTLLSEEAIAYYDNGYREVSPGYTSICEWIPEEKIYNGVAYQIIVTCIPEVNHLALCQAARGGPTVRVMDSKGGCMKKSGLFYRLGKTLSGTKDSVSVKDQLVMLTKPDVTDEQIKLTVDSVMAKAELLPDNEGKEKLTRFLDDLRGAKSYDSALVKDAVNATATLFDTLDAAADDDGDTKDYAVGTTGIAGKGTMKVKAKDDDDKKAKDDDDDKKKKSETTDDDDESEKHESEEMKLLKEILSHLKGTKDDDKKTKDDDKKTKDDDDNKTKDDDDKKVTTDSITATLDSGSKNKAESIDDFMAGFGRK